MRDNESGKSIAGLLKALLFFSCLLGAGYALYFFGSEKSNMQKTAIALNQINEKMHEFFSDTGSYPSSDIIADYQITPQSMRVNNAKEYFWKHYFGGNMMISGVFERHEDTSVPEYNVIFNNLSRRQCRVLAIHDWRENKNFLGLAAYGFGILASNASGKTRSRVRLMSEEEAESACSCEFGNYCSVVLVYK